MELVLVIVIINGIMIGRLCMGYAVVVEMMIIFVVCSVSIQYMRLMLLHGLVLVCDLYFGASITGLVIFASGSGCHYEIDVVGYTAVCQQWYEGAYFWYLGAYLL